MFKKINRKLFLKVLVCVLGFGLVLPQISHADVTQVSVRIIIPTSTAPLDKLPLAAPSAGVSLGSSSGPTLSAGNNSTQTPVLTAPTGSETSPATTLSSPPTAVDKAEKNVQKDIDIPVVKSPLQIPVENRPSTKPQTKIVKNRSSAKLTPQAPIKNPPSEPSTPVGRAPVEMRSSPVENITVDDRAVHVITSENTKTAESVTVPAPTQVQTVEVNSELSVVRNAGNIKSSAPDKSIVKNSLRNSVQKTKTVAVAVSKTVKKNIDIMVQGTKEVVRSVAKLPKLLFKSLSKSFQISWFRN